MLRTAPCMLLLVLLAAGCGGDATASVDASVEQDASLGRDASAADARNPGDDGGGSGDAGQTPDGGASACAFADPFDVGVVYERTLHVAPGGSSGNDGSEASPLDSVETAAARATPGTRILVHAGTYRGGQWIGDLHGEEGRPIAIVGQDGAILDAAGDAEVLHLSEVSYVVLEHLELTGGTANGLNIDDGGSYETPSHHIVLRDLHVHDVGTGGNNDCIKLSGVDDYFVLGSRVAECDAGDIIDQVGCHRGRIAGNTFGPTPGGGIQMKGGSADILVHGNRFTGVEERAINAGGSTGLEYFRPIDAPYEAARLAIVANVFEQSGGDCIVAFVGCDACVFANNTIVEPQGWIARVLQETTGARFVPSRNGRFVNNLIVFRVADVRPNEYNVGPDTAPETYTFGSNLWYALDAPDWPGPNADGPGITEVGSIVGMDPRLGPFPYRICAGESPADGAGRSVAEAIIDFGGRCYDDPPSIGAHEARSCAD